MDQAGLEVVSKNRDELPKKLVLPAPLTLAGGVGLPAAGPPTCSHRMQISPSGRPTTLSPPPPIPACAMPRWPSLWPTHPKMPPTPPPPISPPGVASLNTPPPALIVSATSTRFARWAATSLFPLAASPEPNWRHTSRIRTGSGSVATNWTDVGGAAGGTATSYRLWAQ